MVLKDSDVERIVKPPSGTGPEGVIRAYHDGGVPAVRNRCRVPRHRPVVPDQITDAEASELSDQIARRIESDLQYPGQIKVVVIRETRAVDFAR